MKYIELNNWGNGYRVGKETFRTDLIEGILCPKNVSKDSSCGCIIVIQGVRYPVEESYSEVCSMLNTKNEA